jgi:hypothetical protein
MVDPVNGPGNDITDPKTTGDWADRISAGEFDTVGFSPDCSSYSRLRQHRVRDGVTCELLPCSDLPERIRHETGAAYAARQNALTDAVLLLLARCIHSGTDYWLEQPLDVVTPNLTGSSRPNPHYQARSRGPSLFRLERFLATTAADPGVHVHFIQCPLGAVSKKPTTILASARIAAILAPLESGVCTCPDPHPRARGRDATGASRSRLSQAYPGPLCYHIARATDACAPRHSGSRDHRMALALRRATSAPTPPPADTPSTDDDNTSESDTGSDPDDAPPNTPPPTVGIPSGAVGEARGGALARPQTPPRGSRPGGDGTVRVGTVRLDAAPCTRLRRVRRPRLLPFHTRGHLRGQAHSW